MIFEQNNNRGVVSFSCFLAFILLLTAVKLQAGWLFNLDRLIQSVAKITPGSHAADIFQVLTFFGSPEVVLIVSLILVITFIVIKEKVTALWITLTVLGGYALAYGIKLFVQRPRPAADFVKSTGFSFPSGHTFGTAILTMILIVIIAPRLKQAGNRFLMKSLLIIWLILVVISRVFLRSHYPTDVLGSLLLAAGWWNFAEMLYFRFYGRANKVLKEQPEESN